MILKSQIASYRNTLMNDAGDENSPTIENSRHQSRVINAAAKHSRKLAAAGLKPQNYADGITISDYGKTPEGKELLTKASSDSNLLILTLQGKAKNIAAKAFEEVLEERFGNKNHFINPNLSPDQVREQFNRDPRLVGLFHELPGLLLLIKDFNNRSISAKDFREQLLATAFHNGPEGGFWKDILISGVNSKLEENAITLHLNTVFSNENNQISYPHPYTEGLLHTVYDRFDQGLNGLPKLAKEVSPWADIDNLKDNLLGTNNKWTLDQLTKLQEIIAKAVEAKPGFKFVSGVTEKAIDKLSRFGDYVKQRFVFDGDKNSAQAEFVHPDGSREVLKKIGNGIYQHHINVVQPANSREFMSKNVAQFLSRVVSGFEEHDRYQMKP